MVGNSETIRLLAKIVVSPAIRRDGWRNIAISLIDQ